jgi:hypothetical protein
VTAGLDRRFSRQRCSGFFHAVEIADGVLSGWCDERRRRSRWCGGGAVWRF